MKRMILTILIGGLTSISVLGQTATSTPSPTPDPEKEKAQMIAFLRDTDQEVSNLRLPENRVALFAEIGSIMWQFDEQQARALYAKAVGDLQQLIIEHNNAVAAEKAAKAADADALTVSFVGSVFGTGSQADAQTLRSVRENVLLAIADNDPDLAMNALATTADIEVDKENDIYRFVAEDTLASKIASRVAARSPKRALELALDSLKKGLSSSHLDILQKLNEADPDSAKTLGAAMLSKAKDSKVQDYILSRFLSTADFLLEESKKKESKQSPFTHAEVREIAGLLADKIQENGGLSYYIDDIEKYLPARAAALRAKNRSNSNISGNFAVPPPVSTGNASNSNSMGMEDDARQKRQSEDRKSLEAFTKLSNGKLPKEEREKVLAEARKTVLRIRDPRDKVLALTAIATGVVSSDKELAMELMREADRLAPLYPKTMMDFMTSYAVASGYAMVDPEQAFSRFEALIASTNEIINAGVKIAEFIDVSGTMVKDNELKVGVLGGPIAGEMGNVMATAGAPIRSLAEYDLIRTQALTDRFDRPEARVLAKLLVLRAYATKFAAKPVVPDAETDTPVQVPDALK
ncbi:MAG: hypothetical protein K1X52_12590 [Pyrinomonadaceae bacterium]|nr:hypothetical protein [Pyrinomonadaceae bacterium]